MWIVVVDEVSIRSVDSLCGKYPGFLKIMFIKNFDVFIDDCVGTNCFFEAESSLI